jgi:hypothetical protein
MRFTSEAGNDPGQERLRWLKKQFELAGRIADLEGNRDRPPEEPDIFRLKPEDE